MFKIRVPVRNCLTMLLQIDFSRAMICLINAFFCLGGMSFPFKRRSKSRRS